MRDPVNFPPLSAEKTAEIETKIKERKLDYPDLFPVIAHLAYSSPRTLVLTPAKHQSLPGEPEDKAHDREIAFHFAAGAMHDTLMKGELPTAPTIKYPTSFPIPLLDPANEHENALRKAAVVAEMFLSDKVTVYADQGVDGEMKEMIGFAKALKIGVNYKLLHLPEYWAGAPTIKNLEKALKNHDDIPEAEGFHAKLTPQRKKDIQNKLEAKALTSADVLDAALYIHDNDHIVVESPYAPKYGKESPKSFGVMDLSINMRMAYAAQKSLLLEGNMPSASHTEFTFNGVLDDTVTHERVLGIAAGLAKTLFFDESRLYDNRDISSGMQKGVEFAVKVERPVYRYRVHDLPAEYWRTSFESYIEETFKPKYEAMEQAMEIAYPDLSDPDMTRMAVAYMPKEGMKNVSKHLDEKTLDYLGKILPEDLMKYVTDSRAEALEEEANRKVFARKPSPIEKLRAVAP